MKQKFSVRFLACMLVLGIILTMAPVIGLAADADTVTIRIATSSDTGAAYTAADVMPDDVIAVTGTDADPTAVEKLTYDGSAYAWTTNSNPKLTVKAAVALAITGNVDYIYIGASGANVHVKGNVGGARSADEQSIYAGGNGVRSTIVIDGTFRGYVSRNGAGSYDTYFKVGKNSDGTYKLDVLLDDGYGTEINKVAFDGATLTVDTGDTSAVVNQSAGDVTYDIVMTAGCYNTNDQVVTGKVTFAAGKTATVTDGRNNTDKPTYTRAFLADIAVEKDASATIDGLLHNPNMYTMTVGENAVVKASYAVFGTDNVTAIGKGAELYLTNSRENHSNVNHAAGVEAGLVNAINTGRYGNDVSFHFYAAGGQTNTFGYGVSGDIATASGSIVTLWHYGGEAAMDEGISVGVGATLNILGADADNKLTINGGKTTQVREDGKLSLCYVDHTRNDGVEDILTASGSTVAMDTSTTYTGSTAGAGTFQTDADLNGVYGQPAEVSGVYYYEDDADQPHWVKLNSGDEKVLPVADLTEDSTSTALALHYKVELNRSGDNYSIILYTHYYDIADAEKAADLAEPMAIVSDGDSFELQYTTISGEDAAVDMKDYTYQSIGELNFGADGYGSAKVPSGYKMELAVNSYDYQTEGGPQLSLYSSSTVTAPIDIERFGALKKTDKVSFKVQPGAAADGDEGAITHPYDHDLGTTSDLSVDLTNGSYKADFVVKTGDTMTVTIHDGASIHVDSTFKVEQHGTLILQSDGAALRDVYARITLDEDDSTLELSNVHLNQGGRRDQDYASVEVAPNIKGVKILAKNKVIIDGANGADGPDNRTGAAPANGTAWHSYSHSQSAALRVDGQATVEAIQGATLTINGGDAYDRTDKAHYSTEDDETHHVRGGDTPTYDGYVGGAAVYVETAGRLTFAGKGVIHITGGAGGDGADGEIGNREWSTFDHSDGNAGANGGDGGAGVCNSGVVTVAMDSQTWSQGQLIVTGGQGGNGGDGGTAGQSKHSCPYDGHTGDNRGVCAYSDQFSACYDYTYGGNAGQGGNSGFAFIGGTNTDAQYGGSFAANAGTLTVEKGVLLTYSGTVTGNGGVGGGNATVAEGNCGITNLTVTNCAYYTCTQPDDHVAGGWTSCGCSMSGYPAPGAHCIHYANTTTHTYSGRDGTETTAPHTHTALYERRAHSTSGADVAKPADNKYAVVQQTLNTTGGTAYGFGGVENHGIFVTNLDVDGGAIFGGQKGITGFDKAASADSELMVPAAVNSGVNVESYIDGSFTEYFTRIKVGTEYSKYLVKSITLYDGETEAPYSGGDTGMYVNEQGFLYVYTSGAISSYASADLVLKKDDDSQTYVQVHCGGTPGSDFQAYGYGDSWDNTSGNAINYDAKAVWGDPIQVDGMTAGNGVSMAFVEELKTTEGPVAIKTPEQLAALAYTLNNGLRPDGFAGVTFKLAPVDPMAASSATVSVIEMARFCWTPIGTEADPFRGTFNGLNTTVKGLRMSTERDYTAFGLFGYTDGAVIQDLTISGEAIEADAYAKTLPTESKGELVAAVSGGQYTWPVGMMVWKGDSAATGAFIGRAVNTQVLGCTAKTLTIQTNHWDDGDDMMYAGGIAGLSQGSDYADVTVSGSTVKGTANEADTYAGGVIGWSAGDLVGDAEVLSSAVNATGKTGEAGGLLGHSEGSTVYRSFVRGGSMGATTHHANLVGHAIGTELYGVYATGTSGTYAAVAESENGKYVGCYSGSTADFIYQNKNADAQCFNVYAVSDSGSATWSDSDRYKQLTSDTLKNTSLSDSPMASMNQELNPVNARNDSGFDWLTEIGTPVLYKPDDGQNAGYPIHVGLYRVTFEVDDGSEGYGFARIDTTQAATKEGEKVFTIYYHDEASSYWVVEGTSFLPEVKNLRTLKNNLLYTLTVGDAAPVAKEIAINASGDLTANTLDAVTAISGDHYYLLTFNQAEPIGYRVNLDLNGGNLEGTTVTYTGEGEADIQTIILVVNKGSLELPALPAGWVVDHPDSTIGSKVYQLTNDSGVTAAQAQALLEGVKIVTDGPGRYEVRVMISPMKFFPPYIDLSDVTADYVSSSRGTDVESYYHSSFMPWIDDIPFVDVTFGDELYEAVWYVYKEGLMMGTAYDIFAPDTTLSRAMIWTILARMDGISTETWANQPWYYTAQQWCMGQGITDGTDPNGAVTRLELVTMLWRYMGKPGAGSEVPNASAVPAWGLEALRWAAEKGMIPATSWNIPATRGETATALYLM